MFTSVYLCSRSISLYLVSYSFFFLVFDQFNRLVSDCMQPGMEWNAWTEQELEVKHGIWQFVEQRMATA